MSYFLSKFLECEIDQIYILKSIYSLGNCKVETQLYHLTILKSTLYCPDSIYEAVEYHLNVALSIMNVLALSLSPRRMTPQLVKQNILSKHVLYL